MICVRSCRGHRWALPGFSRAGCVVADGQIGRPRRIAGPPTTVGFMADCAIVSQVKRMARAAGLLVWTARDPSPERPDLIWASAGTCLPRACFARAGPRKHHGCNALCWRELGVGGRLSVLARAMREQGQAGSGAALVDGAPSGDAVARVARDGLSRRGLLRIGGAAGVAAALAACTSRSSTAAGKAGTAAHAAQGVRVAVVGAGLAGTTAAYRLARGGVQVRLFEVRDRIGGRCGRPAGSLTARPPSAGASSSTPGTSTCAAWPPSSACSSMTCGRGTWSRRDTRREVHFAGEHLDVLARVRERRSGVGPARRDRSAARAGPPGPARYRLAAVFADTRRAHRSRRPLVTAASGSGKAGQAGRW